MRQRRHAAMTVVLGLVATLGVTGCTPFACPAIGWTNGLAVELEGDAAAVAGVQLCTDEGCAPTQEPDPAHPLGLITLIEQDGRSWVFSTDMYSLDEVTVRLTEADGTVIGETAFAPDWERVGGSARCGGPSVATVTVRVGG